MKRSTLISLLALAAALTGLVIAVAAFLYRRRDLLCDDDFDDELLDSDLDYYASQVDEATPEQNVDAVDDAHPLEHGLGENDSADFYEEDEKTE